MFNRLRHKLTTATLSIVCGAGVFSANHLYAQVPEGFEDLVAEQSTLVDVFFGGVYVSTALATFNTETLTFEAPQEIVTNISSVNDKKLLLERLKQPLEVNAALVCYAPGQQDCGALDTEDVGIIFDEGTFRVDLFINSRLQALKGEEATRFLPPSSSSFSHLSNLSLSAAGSNEDSLSYAFFGQSTLSNKEHRLRSIYSLSKNSDDKNRFLVENIFWEFDKRDKEYRAGVFPSNVRELSLIPNNDIAGIRYASTTKTRTDLSRTRGIPIQVFLQNRSRVEIRREGRLISAKFYEAGNQILDTSALPEGAYNITIRINDITNREEELERFFVKTARIPPRDQNLFFFEAGEVLSLDRESGFPESVGTATLRGGYSARINDSSGYQLGLAVVESESVLESGVFYIHPLFQTEARFLLSSGGDIGAGLNSFFRIGKLSGGISAQVIESENHLEQTTDYRLIDGRRQVLTGSFNYPLYRGQLTLQSSLVQRAEESSEVLHGLSWFRNFRTRRSGQWSTSFQLSKSPDELSTFLQFTWRRDSGEINHSLSAGIRETRFQDNNQSIRNADDGFSPTANYLASWNDGERFDSELQSTLSVNVEKDRQDLFFTNNLRNAFGRADISLGSQRADGLDTTSSYSINLGTSVIGETSYLGYGGNEAAESAVLLDIEGTADRGSFDILINDRFHSKASVNDKVVVPLLSYNTYEVDLRDSGDEFISFNGRKESVTLYPGNVKRVRFRADNLYVLIGRVLRFNSNCTEGAPLDNLDDSAVRDCWQPFTNAKTDINGLSVRTDEEGYIQIEITGDNSEITFTDNQFSCSVPVPYQFAEGSLIYAEDDLRCFTMSQFADKKWMADYKEKSIDSEANASNDEPAESTMTNDNTVSEFQESDCREIESFAAVGRRGQLIRTSIDCDQNTINNSLPAPIVNEPE